MDAFEQGWTMGQMPGVERFLKASMKCGHLEACWQLLAKELAQYGFDRLLYGHRLRVDPAWIHNLADTLILSTHPPKRTRFVFEQRHFVHDAMYNWVVRNVGAMSWSYSRDRYASGEASKEECEYYEASAREGIVSGYSYAFPDRGSGYKSAFGLCYRAGVDQEHVDAVWAEHETEIIALLNVFELCVSSLPNHDPEEALSQRQAEILSLAAEGRTISEIAELLGIHRRTVDNHMTKAREILGVGSTLQAAVRAVRQRQI